MKCQKGKVRSSCVRKKKIAVQAKEIKLRFHNVAKDMQYSLCIVNLTENNTASVQGTFHLTAAKPENSVQMIHEDFILGLNTSNFI